MEGPPLGPGREDITWPDQAAPRGGKASSTRKIKPQNSNLVGSNADSREEVMGSNPTSPKLFFPKVQAQASYF